MISVHRGKKLIRRQIARDTAREVGFSAAGKAIGFGAGFYAAKRFGATAALERGMQRFGVAGQKVAKWGPATVGAGIGSSILGASTVPKTYRENRDLAKKLGLPKSTVSPIRAASPIPASFAVRKAFKRAHPGY